MRGDWPQPLGSIRAVAAALMWGLVVAMLALASAWAVVGARADTLEWALATAYQTNPQLNSQRAITRSTDENVPQALSGYRPSITATASAGRQWQRTVTRILPDQLTGVPPSLKGAQTVTQGTFDPRTVARPLGRYPHRTQFWIGRARSRSACSRSAGTAVSPATVQPTGREH